MQSNIKMIKILIKLVKLCNKNIAILEERTMTREMALAFTTNSGKELQKVPNNFIQLFRVYTDHQNYMKIKMFWSLKQMGQFKISCRALLERG